MHGGRWLCASLLDNTPKSGGPPTFSPFPSSSVFFFFFFFLEPKEYGGLASRNSTFNHPTHFFLGCRHLTTTTTATPTAGGIVAVVETDLRPFGVLAFFSKSKHWVGGR